MLHRHTLTTMRTLTKRLASHDGRILGLLCQRGLCSMTTNHHLRRYRRQCLFVPAIPTRWLSAGSQSLLVVVPAMGDSITNGEIVEFTKNVGDAVAEDDVVAIIETDKVSVDVRAPSAGVVMELHAEPGAVVDVGATLVTLAPSGSSVPPATPPQEQEQQKQKQKEQAEEQVFEQAEEQVFEEHTNRKPLIHFRHGMANVSAASAAGMQQPAFSLHSPLVLPEVPSRYVRAPLSDYEMELIELGGAEPY